MSEPYQEQFLRAEMPLASRSRSSDLRPTLGERLKTLAAVASGMMGLLRLLSNGSKRREFIATVRDASRIE